MGKYLEISDKFSRKLSMDFDVGRKPLAFLKDIHFAMVFP